MTYPREILPNSFLKEIACDLSDYSLYRWFNLKEGMDIIDTDTKNIQQQYIANPTQNIIDLSTIFFDVYDTQYINIVLTPAGNELYNSYCVPDCIVPTPNYPEHFEVKTGRHCFYLKIHQIHNKELEYEFQGISHKCRCVAIHTPMKSNFWHFSIRWIIGHNNEYLHEQDVKLLGKNWVRRLSSAARSMITHHATLEKPEINIIPATCYSKFFIPASKSKVYFIKRLFAKLMAFKLYIGNTIKDFLNIYMANLMIK